MKTTKELDDDLIARWRASAADPADADKDELELRRHLSEIEAEHIERRNKDASDKKPCTRGDLNTFAGDIGTHMGLGTKVLRRELMFELRKLANRVTAVESKSERKVVIRRERKNALIKAAKRAAKRS